MESLKKIGHNFQGNGFIFTVVFEGVYIRDIGHT